MPEQKTNVHASPEQPTEYQAFSAELFDREPSDSSGPIIGEGSLRPDPKYPFKVVARAMLAGADVVVVYGIQNDHGIVSLTEHVETAVPTFPVEPDLLEGLIDLSHIPDCRYDTDCTEVDFLPSTVVVRRGFLRVPRDEQRVQVVRQKTADMFRALLGTPPQEDLLSPDCQHAALVVERLRSHMLYGDDPLWVAMRAVHPNLPYPPTLEEIYHPRTEHLLQ